MLKLLTDYYARHGLLVSVMAVNNEIGSIQPIQAISDILADEPTISFMWMLLVIGKIPVSAYLTDRVDFNFSGHSSMLFRCRFCLQKGREKDYAPNRWWSRKDFRSTTENVVGIASMKQGLALSY